MVPTQGIYSKERDNPLETSFLEKPHYVESPILLAFHTAESI